jgi:hypothetical protein
LRKVLQFYSEKPEFLIPSLVEGINQHLSSLPDLLKDKKAIQSFLDAYAPYYFRNGRQEKAIASDWKVVVDAGYSLPK